MDGHGHAFDEEAQPQQRSPLLERNGSDAPATEEDRKTFLQGMLKSTANLANHLPTGTVLAFQVLAPIFAKDGQCDSASRRMTWALLGVFAACCFVLGFTDTVKDKNGKVRHVIATIRGVWVIDGGDEVPEITVDEGAKYKMKFVDFIHGFMSILVFAAVVLFDENVVACLYPEPSEQTKQMIPVFPVAIGALCSLLFIVCPTKRHGVGFPLTSS
ncbi:hypothetical protein ACLOJK_009789 [Asimina triloba]